MNPRTKRTLTRAGQAIVAALVAWYVAAALGGQWGQFRELSGSLHPHWGMLAASGAIVLATYALLIDVWRRLVATGGVTVPFWRAARIWFVSSLGKYVPGKVWSIAAMGAMAQREGVSPAIAAAAAVLSQAINLAAGFAVVAVGGARVVPLMVGGSGRAALAVAALVGVGLLAVPAVLPRAAAYVGRRIGRPVTVEVAPRTLWFAVVANIVAWLSYGAAFHLFAHALDVGLRGGWLASTAVFTGSYVLGYLVLFVPGGLGVREVTMGAALTGLHLSSPVEATVVVVASRLWLTALEIVPGVAFLARDAVSRPPRTST